MGLTCYWNIPRNIWRTTALRRNVRCRRIDGRSRASLVVVGNEDLFHSFWECNCLMALYQTLYLFLHSHDTTLTVIFQQMDPLLTTNRRTPTQWTRIYSFRITSARVTCPSHLHLSVSLTFPPPSHRVWFNSPLLLSSNKLPLPCAWYNIVVHDDSSGWGLSRRWPVPLCRSRRCLCVWSTAVRRSRWLPGRRWRRRLRYVSGRGSFGLSSFISFHLFCSNSLGHRHLCCPCADAPVRLFVFLVAEVGFIVVRRIPCGSVLRLRIHCAFFILFIIQSLSRNSFSSSWYRYAFYIFHLPSVCNQFRYWYHYCISHLF